MALRTQKATSFYAQLTDGAGGADHIMPLAAGDADHIMPLAAGDADHIMPLAAGDADHIMPLAAGDVDHMPLDAGADIDVDVLREILNTDACDLDVDFARMHDQFKNDEMIMPTASTMGVEGDAMLTADGLTLHRVLNTRSISKDAKLCYARSVTLLTYMAAFAMTDSLALYVLRIRDNPRMVDAFMDSMRENPNIWVAVVNAFGVQRSQWW
jgi:hypothetical protein